MDLYSKLYISMMRGNIYVFVRSKSIAFQYFRRIFIESISWIWNGRERGRGKRPSIHENISPIHEKATEIEFK